MSTERLYLYRTTGIAGGGGGFPVTLYRGCPFVSFIHGLFKANSRTIGMFMSVTLHGSPCGNRKNSKCQFTLFHGPSALKSLSFPTDINPGNKS